MFRKISLFLVSSSFLISSAFAEVDYLTSWSIIRKSCTKGLTWNATGVTKRPTNCVELDPEQEEVLNKTLDWFKTDNGYQSVELELIKRSNDYFVRGKFCDAAGCEIQEVPAGLLAMIDPYSLQKIAPDFVPEPDNSIMKKSQAVPHRLFTLGPNTAALKNDYVVYTLDASDLPTSAKKVIFANPSTKTALGGSAAPDGGMAVQLTADSKTWTMSTRRLKDGLPIGAPYTWTVPAYSGYSPDLTNAIEVSSEAAGAAAVKIRYLVFRAFRNVGTTSQQSQIMIQTIDDSTGKPLGDAKPLTSFVKAYIATAEAIQSIAIAPDGNLMLFTVYSDACKRQILRMVRLTNGSSVGGATTLVGCSGLAATPAGVLGLDIMLPDQPSASLPK